MDMTKAELVRENTKLKMEVRELKNKLKKKGLLKRLFSFFF